MDAITSSDVAAFKYAAKENACDLNNTAMMTGYQQAEFLKAWMNKRTDKCIESVTLQTDILHKLATDAGVTVDDVLALDGLSVLENSGQIIQYEAVHDQATDTYTGVKVWAGEAYQELRLGGVTSSYIPTHFSVGGLEPTEVEAYAGLIEFLKPISYRLVNILELLHAGDEINRLDQVYFTTFRFKGGDVDIKWNERVNHALEIHVNGQLTYFVQATLEPFENIWGLLDYDDGVIAGLSDFTDNLSDTVDEALQTMSFLNNTLSAGVSTVKTDIIPLIAGGMNSTIDEVHDIAETLASTPSDERLSVAIQFAKDKISAVATAAKGSIEASQDDDPGVLDMRTYTVYTTTDVCSGAWEVIKTGATAAFSIMAVAGTAIVKGIAAIGYGAFMLVDWFMQQASLHEGPTINFETNEGYQYANGLRVAGIVGPQIAYGRLAIGSGNRLLPYAQTIHSCYSFMKGNTTFYRPYDPEAGIYDDYSFFYNGVMYPNATAGVLDTSSDLFAALNNTAIAWLTPYGFIHASNNGSNSLTLNAPDIQGSDFSATRLAEYMQARDTLLGTNALHLAWSEDNDYNRLDMHIRAMIFRHFVYYCFECVARAVIGMTISSPRFKAIVSTLSARSTRKATGVQTWGGVQGMCAAIIGFPLVEDSFDYWPTAYQYLSGYGAVGSISGILQNAEDAITSNPKTMPYEYRGIWDILGDDFGVQLLAWIMGDLPQVLIYDGLVDVNLDAEIPGFNGAKLSQYVPSWEQLNKYLTTRSLSLWSFNSSTYNFPTKRGVPVWSWYSLARAVVADYQYDPIGLVNDVFTTHLSYADAAIGLIATGLEYYSRTLNAFYANPMPWTTKFNPLCEPETILQLAQYPGRIVDYAYNEESGSKISSTVQFYIAGGVSINDNPHLVERPCVIPPKYAKGSALRALIIAATVTVAITVSALVIKKKISNWRKVRVLRREQEALSLQEDLLNSSSTDADYKVKQRRYLKAQRKYQRAARRVGYSSNSLGSFSSGSTSDIIREQASSAFSEMADAVFPPEAQTLKASNEYDPSASIDEKLDAISGNLQSYSTQINNEVVNVRRLIIGDQEST